ncbi:MAG: hypothetical protein U1A78_34260 [Polyangia bacterium]
MTARAAGAGPWALLLATLTACRGGFSSEAPISGRAPQVSVAATALLRPTAAALSASGDTVYVAQLQPEGAALIAVSAGGAPLKALSLPLGLPLALAALPDDSGVLVVDAADPGDAAGAAYLIDPAGQFRRLALDGVRVPVAIAAAPDSRAAYVAGRDAADDQAAIWRMPLDGGAPELFYKGAPLTRPLALAFAEDGYLYAADADGLGARQGAVLRIEAGRAVLINHTALPLGPGAGLCPSAAGSGKLLLLGAPAQPAWLIELAVDGSWQAFAPQGPSPHEPLALSRAARADVWLAVDGVREAQPDPGDPAQGQLLRLTP